MPKYKLIMVDIWKDPDFEQLDPIEKLLFIYFFSNQSITESGIYPITTKTISQETGIKESQVAKMLKDGIKNIVYDSTTRHVFVVNHRKYNSTGGRPDLIEKSILTDRSRMNTGLWNLFIDKYPEFKDKIQPLANGCPTVDQPFLNYTKINETKDIAADTDSNGVNNASSRARIALMVLDCLNTRARHQYGHFEANLAYIKARLKEGASYEDCTLVIEDKVREWVDDSKMSMYLRPSTLFDRTKFNEYLGIAKGKLDKKESRKGLNQDRPQESRDDFDDKEKKDLHDTIKKIGDKSNKALGKEK